jgi:hypothetical protein
MNRIVTESLAGAGRFAKPLESSGVCKNALESRVNFGFKPAAGAATNP